MNPIETMFEQVEWTEHPIPDDCEGLYLVKSGILNLMGKQLECHVLSDGRRIFTTESIAAVFGAEPESAKETR